MSFIGGLSRCDCCRQRGGDRQLEELRIDASKAICLEGAQAATDLGDAWSGRYWFGWLRKGGGGSGLGGRGHELMPGAQPRARR